MIFRSKEFCRFWREKEVRQLLVARIRWRLGSGAAQGGPTTSRSFCHANVTSTVCHFEPLFWLRELVIQRRGTRERNAVLLQIGA
jgi:hypothetical protein